MTGSTFQPKNTKQTYTNLQTIDYLVQTLGIDSTGANTILGLLETLNTGSSKSPKVLYGQDGGITPIEVGSGGPQYLVGLSIYNPNNADMFLKFYGEFPTIGTTTPTMIFQIPALGSLIITGNYNDIILKETLAMYFAFTSGYLDNSVAAPGTNLSYAISYQ